MDDKPAGTPEHAEALRRALEVLIEAREALHVLNARLEYARLLMRLKAPPPGG